MNNTINDDQLYLKVSTDENSTNTSKSKTCMTRPSPIFVFVSYFLYFLSIFFSSALTQQLIITVSCAKLNADDCSSASISKVSSRIFFYSSLCTTVPCFLMSGPLGALSDSYGRKLILIITSCGLFLYTIGITYIAYFKPDNYVSILIISSVLYGVCGGFQGFQLGCYAYLADVTNSRLKYRTLYYSMLESFLIMAKVVGPISAGYYASQNGFFPPLAVATIIALLVVIFVNIIPESLQLDHQQSFKIEPFKSFQNIKVLFTLKAISGSSPLPLISVAFGLYFTTYLGYLNVYVLYLKHTFHSNVEIVGYYASAESLVSVISMLVLPSIVKRLLGSIVKSIYWVQIGYVAQSIFFFLFASVTSEKQIFMCLLVLIFAGPIVPMTRAILVNSVAPHLQTTILGGISAIQSTSQLLCPLIIIVYSDNVEKKPAMDFYSFSAVNALCAMLISLLFLNSSFSENLPDTDGLVKDRITDDAITLSSYLSLDKLNDILFGESSVCTTFDDDRNNSIESIDNGFYESLLIHNNYSTNQVEI